MFRPTNETGLVAANGTRGELTRRPYGKGVAQEKRRQAAAQGTRSSGRPHCRAPLPRGKAICLDCRVGAHLHLRSRADRRVAPGTTQRGPLLHDVSRCRSSTARAAFASGFEPRRGAATNREAKQPTSTITLARAALAFCINLFPFFFCSPSSVCFCSCSAVGQRSRHTLSPLSWPSQNENCGYTFDACFGAGHNTNSMKEKVVHKTRSVYECRKGRLHPKGGEINEYIGCLSRTWRWV